MTPSARISSAIEVLTTIETDRRPAADVLTEWGRAHRFAGSGDRAAMASLVYDALRVRRSAQFALGEDSPRAMMIGMLNQAREKSPDEIAALFTGEGFAPAPLSETERLALENSNLDTAPADVRGNVPDWLWPHFEAAFGADAAEEGAALSTRAPLDLRVNALKALRPAVIKSLSHLRLQPSPHAPDGLRITMPKDGRRLSLEGEPAYIKGLVEVQDEGSQLVSLMAGAKAGQQVLDLCAGGGGKSLALAALMNNKGQIFATDSEARRLAPIHERIDRAGVRNIQVRTPRGKAMMIDDLEDEMDIVLVDAPCTGTGTWRRNPDAKWRIRPGSLAERQKEQRDVLAIAERYVQPGGKLVYITCSVLKSENDQQIEEFLSTHSGYQAVPAETVKAQAGLANLPCHTTQHGLLLTPRLTGTDGFYCSVLRRLS